MPSGKASKRHRKEFMANQSNNLPNQDDQSVVVARQETYVGPLPDPKMLEEYKNAGPSFPERIMAMAEAHNAADVTTKYRMSLSNLIVPIIGQVFTLVLGAGGIIAGIYLATAGYSGPAIVSVISGFSPIIITALRNLKRNS